MTIIINDYIGTTAGQPAYVPFKGGRTYARILDGMGISVAFARAVQHMRENDISTFENLENNYSNMRIANQPPEYFGNYFKILYRDDRLNLTSHTHALEKLGKPLEELTGISIADLKHQSQSYGMVYLLNRYFDGIETAEDGALVVYYDRYDNAVHSGIYHKYNGRTWRTEGGGTIESRWAHRHCGSPYVFEHEPFFLPKEFGNIAKFYKVKKVLPPLTLPAKHEGAPMYEAIDGALQFVRNADNEKIRSTIDTTRLDEVLQIYPQIQRVSDIKFAGVCFMFAMDKIFQSRVPVAHEIVPEREYDLLAAALEKVPIREYDLCGLQPSKFLEEFFIPVAIPQVGDLAVYTRNGYRNHFGVFIADDFIESKWGSRMVYRHPPFYVDTDCGRTLTCYRLKSSYQKFLTNS